MEEYEFLEKALDSYLVDKLVSVICQEQYEGVKYIHGFRRIFDDFIELHNDYLAHEAEFMNSASEMQLYKMYEALWKTKRIEQEDTIFKDLKINVRDFDRLVEDYNSFIKQDGIEKIERRVLKYPYLFRLLRDEEGVV